MPRNILITGAAGYMFVFPSISHQTDEQAKALSIHGTNVLKLDLSDEHAVVNEISSHKISVVVHAANSIDPGLILPLINGLAKQKEATGKPTYFIHTSGLSAFYANSGWPRTINTDTDAVFETEKEFVDSYPVRKTDVTVIEHAQAHGVTPFIVVPSIVYGRGTGPWNQLSVVIPGLIRASLKLQKVYRFDENISLQAVHISDLTALYCRIIHAALNKEEIPSGKEGYYFAVVHDLDMWEFQDRLAAAIKARGHFTATRPQSIGWKPKWDRERFLKNADAEIGGVVELGKAKSSLVDSLFAAVGRAR
ncbi:hypothetical protein FCIRC_4698 [Fusarium circinatum]|uniref:NAD-dependent epimerase/dehydratase domain-containing protein n=1 Tax=Fusarium circinatum TaxID=48490 RepID=A0A8H5U8P0_FUSCI|nr:hypothetical protein FCIRC_4698 [Fusarium circinatum]